MPPDPVDLSGGSPLELDETDWLVEADPRTGAGSELLKALLLLLFSGN